MSEWPKLYPHYLHISLQEETEYERCSLAFFFFSFFFFFELPSELTHALGVVAWIHLIVFHTG